MPKKYVLALVVFTIIFFGGVFLLIKLVFGGKDTPSAAENPTTTQNQKVNKLSKDGRKVSYTVYGQVLAEEDRRAIRITIDDTERRVEVLQGYDESVKKIERLPNKSSAFDAFLIGLETAGFTARDISIKTDEKSVCPLGNTYVFQTEFDDRSTVRSWVTSCAVKGASFRGNRSSVETLFKAQIPEYQKIISDVNL
jgi:hypothetical protein